MVAGLEHVGRGGAGDAGADRDAAAERLGAGDHVRPAPGSARRPRASRSARPRSGSRRGSAARRPRRRPARAASSASSEIGWTPASPWIGSIRTAAVFSPTASRRASASLRGTERKPGSIGPSASLRGERRRRREGAVAAAVEVALEADDLRRRDAAAVGVLAGDLDRALVGLGAGVGEEDAAAEARLREPLRQARHRLGVEEVGDVHQPRRLLLHRRDHGRVAVAERADRDPGEEVEVLLAVGVPEQRPFAADEVDRARL